MTTRTGQIEVGTRIKATADMPYTDKRGTGVHHVVRIIEVVAINGNHADYRTVEILEESGQPVWVDTTTGKSWSPNPMNMSGGFRIDQLSQIKRFEVL